MVYFIRNFKLSAFIGSNFYDKNSFYVSSIVSKPTRQFFKCKDLDKSTHQEKLNKTEMKIYLRKFS